MYNSYLDILLEVKRKYSDPQVTKLSQDGNGCFYNHDINGIGCAIGCLFSYDDAAELERIGTYIGYIINYPKDDMTTEFTSVLRTQISEDISWFDIGQLQQLHDSSDTVSEFLEKLDAAILELNS